MDRFQLWRSLLETAIQTPSPHNVQPWRIRLLSDREAELYIDGNRTLPREDTTGSFILSTMGMFVEAIALLAGPRGFSLECELSRPPEWYAQTIMNGEKTELLPFARLHLASSPPRENPYRRPFSINDAPLGSLSFQYRSGILKPRLWQNWPLNGDNVTSRSPT